MPVMILMRCISLQIVFLMPQSLPLGRRDSVRYGEWSLSPVLCASCLKSWLVCMIRQSFSVWSILIVSLIKVARDGNSLPSLARFLFVYFVFFPPFSVGRKQLTFGPACWTPVINSQTYPHSSQWFPVAFGKWMCSRDWLSETPEWILE